MSTEHLTRNTRRLVLGGVAGAVLIVAAAVTADAVTGSSTPSPVTNDAHADAPAAYAAVVGKDAEASTKAGTPLSADLSPSALGRRVTAALGTASGVKAVTVSSAGQKSAISVQMSRNEDSVPQGWYAELAVGAAAQLSATTQTSLDQLIASATAVGPNADGVTTSTDLGVGGVALEQAFDSPSDDVLRSRVDDVAREFGLEVDSVQVLHPLESALSVTLVVPDDLEIDWTIDQLRTALVGATPDVEGVLVQLTAEDGTPLLQAGAAYRTGTGSLWFAPGQDARFGALHGTFAAK
jgi:hypothetical protein